ncbi:MAG TPA: glycoside hydrolase family 3 N-terminal domain-containing protein, partial [Croceibacterium sp.]
MTSVWPPAPLAAQESVAASQRAATVDLHALLARMTTAEKVGQLVQRMGGRQRALNSRLTSEELDIVRRGEAGSYLHVAGAEPLRELQRVAVEESRLRIPLLFAMDVVHGYRTIFPVPLALAATWDPADAESAARIAAREASAAGLHWTFAPMVDVARDPRWGRIVEGAGEDPFLGSAFAVAQVRGFQGADLSRPDAIMAGTKHFGAYGAAEGGRDYAAADVSDRTLRETYLPPFEAAAHAGTASYMTAFNALGGVPTTGNAWLLRSMLRGEWQYGGVMVSDWRSIEELEAHGVAGSRAEAAALALRAGVDIDMVSDVYAQEAAAAAERDPELMRLLDEAVLRILTVKRDLGLFTDPYARHDTAREAEVMLAPAHRAEARRIAERSIVLLENSGNVLPLAKTAGRIALIGALADDARSALGSWKARGEPEDVVTLRSALAAAHPNLAYVPEGAAAAAAAARAADVVVLVLGEDFDRTGEARSMAEIGLPQAQKDLLAAVTATGKPLVVVLMGGRPLAVPELSGLADTAVLGAWLLGDESGPALVRTLFGDANPAGRLPATFPRASGAVPFAYDQLPSGRPASEDLAADTVRWRDQPITPLWAFGHGLSYTSFEYGALTLDRAAIEANGGRVTVSVPVTNTGPRAGDEVVQLYMRDPVASVSRPVKQLRGFRRVALQPGETRTVRFTLDAAHFALW